MYSELQRPPLKPISTTPLNWLRLLIVVILVLGVFFRFVNLDRKVYWGDEAYTSLRISGYTASEVVEEVVNSHEIGIKDLQKYQRTNSEKGLIDTLKGLAVEEPQHPPLYFVIVRLWVQWFGNSVAVIRSLSAFLSLLVFPCLYWLCLELFNVPLTGWMAVALVAISPFHILYAQEAREYSLWTVTILLSSAALLRAMRSKTKLSWGLYVITLALGLYSFLLTVLVAIGHGVYVIVIERFRLNKTVISYFIASVLGFITFIPWLAVVVVNLTALRSTTATNSIDRGIIFVVKEWIRNVRIAFFELNFSLSSSSLYPSRLIAPLILILAGYSIYFLCRHTPKRVWLFVLTLLGGTGLALALPDLIFGGIYSTVPRYIIPCYLGLQISVAYLLSTKITSSRVAQRKVWQVIMAVLISSGVLSCLVLSQSSTAWSKDNGSDNPRIAQIINQANRPLLLTNISASSGNADSNWNLGKVLSLSYILEPKVHFLLVTEENISRIPDSFSEVFLLNPSQGFRAEVEAKQNYKIKLVEEISDDNSIWKLEKR